MSLAGKKIFVTGGSRGIGLAIALKAARDGAMIAIAAKTAEPKPALCSSASMTITHNLTDTSPFQTRPTDSWILE